MKPVTRFFLAATASWGACAFAATLSGLFATAGYLSFYQGAGSSLAYQLKGFVVLVQFGVMLAPLYFIITLLNSAAMLALAWVPAWFLRAKLPMFQRPLVAFLLGSAMGLIYWNFVHYLFRHRPPGRNEIEFAAYVGATLGGGVMFLVGSFFRQAEKRSC